MAAVPAVSLVGLLLPGGQWLGQWVARTGGTCWLCAPWGSAARGSSCSEREGAEEGTALANLVVPRDVFHIPPPTERHEGAQARARSWTSQGGVCAEGPPATKKDRARAARRPLAPLRRPHAPPACHARPKRPAAGGPSSHRTVRRTWCSTRRPRRRGPARRARPREVGSRRCGRERRCVPRGRGRVLHTVCPLGGHVAVHRTAHRGAAATVRFF